MPTAEKYSGAGVLQDERWLWLGEAGRDHVRSYPRLWPYLPLALPLAISGLAASLFGAVAASVSWRARN